MIFEPQPFKVRLRRVAYLFIFLAALYVVAMLVVQSLQMSGKLQAASGMHALTGSMLSGNYKEAVDLHVATPEAAETLKSFDKELGTMADVRWKVWSCQISGTPCILQVHGFRRGKRQDLLLYFHGRICNSAEVYRPPTPDPERVEHR